MYHSIIIGDKNTYDDWYLVSDGRLSVVMPNVKTTLVDIPGGSGTIDLSRLLTQYPVYENRTGEWLFHVLNEKPYTWNELYQKIANYIHGKRLSVKLEDDLDYYYEGIINLKNWTSNNDGTWSDVTIEYIFDPYKYYKNLSTYTSQISNSSSTININESNKIGRMPVIPDINITNVGTGGITLALTNAELGISNKTKTYSANGSYKEYDMVLSAINTNNVCYFTVTGTGKVTISFRKGDL